MPVITQITDEQLHIKLVSSYLDFNQILIISPLIPLLNAEQRQELLKLIDESEKLNSQGLAADAAYDQGLSELNQEYIKKMDQLVVEETKYARKEYEKLGAQKDAQQLTQMEDEISVL